MRMQRECLLVICMTIILLTAGTTQINGKPTNDFNNDIETSIWTYFGKTQSNFPTLSDRPKHPTPHAEYESVLMPQDITPSIPTSLCHEDTLIKKNESCSEYYQCETGESGSTTIRLLSCPQGKIYDDFSKCCNYRHLVSSRPECQNMLLSNEVHEFETEGLLNYNENTRQENKKRQKRFAFQKILGPLVQTAQQLFGIGGKDEESNGPQMDLSVLENMLTGIDGKIKGVELSVLESQAENNLNSKILQNLIHSSRDADQFNFEVTRKMVNQGILENQISSAIIQGLISKQTNINKKEFSRIQVSLGELKLYMKKEIMATQSSIRKGFEKVSNSIIQAKIEPIVSKLLTTIKEFNDRFNHIQSLPETNRVDAIKRDGGYLNYLESSTLANDLREMMQLNMAIPDNEADLSAVFILDFLVQGLRVHTNMMLSIIFSNSFLAARALEETNLDEFNTYMLRISSSIGRINQELGTINGQGLIGGVNKVLNEVQKMTFVDKIFGLEELLREKRTDINQMESDIVNVVFANTEIKQPGVIKGKPDFSGSTIVVPIASWERGKKVRYAIQHVSTTGMSRLGAWSTPYSITSKSNPIVKLPLAPVDVVRVVYRQFNQEKPELVAVIQNNEQSAFRDINRDFLNGAAKLNEEQAVSEVTSLLNAGANVNTEIGNKITPLHYAAKHGNVKVMKILIDNGANIHAKTLDNEEPLHFAALFGTSEGVEYLLSKGAMINAQTRSLGLSPLHIAVANNNADAAKTLVNKGAFVNIKDNKGLTPLHMSVVGNGETTDVLLKNESIDVNTIANDGLTALHYGARSSNDEFVKKLSKHKDIDINPQTGFQLTPIHLAAMSDNVGNLAEFVQRGVPVSFRDTSGYIPLHYAAFYGNQEAILALMQVDESTKNVRNNENKTALNLAEENHHETIAKILKGDLNDLEITFAEEAEYENSGTAVALELLRESGCAADTVDEMAKGSEETCVHIGNIDSYVDLVMSMIPLQIYYETQEDFSLIFQNYDRDLGVAKGHAKIWRNGDSIVNGIRKTFELAREFEPEFTRKYKINQQRVEVIKENVEQVKLINETKDEIQALEQQLANAKEAQAQVQVQAVLAYFQVTIDQINSKLEEKQRALKEDFTLILELEELADFLEFVRTDSNRIREEALKTRGKIETFKADLEHDKGAFERHGEVASSAFEKLKEETIKNNEALAENKRKQDELEKKMTAERELVKSLYVQINDAHEDLRKMRWELLEKSRKAKNKKFWGAILTPLVIGIPLLLQGRAEERSAAVQLQNALKGHKTTVDALNSQISGTREELTVLQQFMANSSSNSLQLRNELSTFVTLDGDLENMAEKVDTLLEAIRKALAGVTIIKDVFDDVTQKLGEMIDLARTAKTEAEKLNAKYFIYNELSLLECNWRDVYFKVMNLDECIRNFQILH